MYYKDQTRRLSLLSGLLLGSVLGTGVALLLGASWRARTWRSLRRLFA